MSTDDKHTTEVAAQDAHADAGFNADAEAHRDSLAIPTGWMYKQRRILGLNIPWYASPQIQLGMVSFVCFLCPGMFNALGGLGGGGKTDFTTADNMVSILTRTTNATTAIAAWLTFLCLLIECRTLQLLCCLWCSWWYLCQQARYQDDPGFWWCWLLHLRHQLVGFRSL